MRCFLRSFATVPLGYGTAAACSGARHAAFRRATVDSTVPNLFNNDSVTLQVHVFHVYVLSVDL